MKATVSASVTQAERDEPEALLRFGSHPPIDILSIPPGTLCIVDAICGEVWLSQGSPQRRWLFDLEDDACLATDG